MTSSPPSTARFPAARVLVAEAAVQGPGAPRAIAAGLAALAREPGIDVVVLARGGGSFEDLLPFSHEQVVRAVAACPVPVVTAVGHEQDTPLCDLAADARASTPTAAARLVVPDEGELRARLAALHTALGREGARAYSRSRERLEQLHGALAREGTRTYERARERLETDRLRLTRAPALLVEGKRASVEALGGRLRTLSPRATLARGYAIVRTEDGVVRAAAGLAPGAARRRRARRGRVRRPRRGNPVSTESEPRLSFEEARLELERIVAELESGKAEPRGGARALGARRGALPALRRQARRGAGQDRGSREARRGDAAPAGVNGALYDFLGRRAEQGDLGARRRELLATVSGDVLEIGAGTGANLAHYRDAGRVVALEPDPGMRRRLPAKIGDAAVPVEVVDGRAESLPFPDASFDAVVSHLRPLLRDRPGPRARRDPARAPPRRAARAPRARARRRKDGALAASA